MIYLTDSESSLKTGLHRLLVCSFILDTSKDISDTKKLFYRFFHAVAIIMHPPDSTMRTQRGEVVTTYAKKGGGVAAASSSPSSESQTSTPPPPLLLHDWYGTDSRKNPPGYLCHCHHTAARGYQPKTPSTAPIQSIALTQTTNDSIISVGLEYLFNLNNQTPEIPRCYYQVLQKQPNKW